MNLRKQQRTDRIVWGSAVLYLVMASHELFAATPPAAAAPVAAGAAVAPQTPAQHYQKECGDCHMAYPARLLPAPSWRALMSGLERHFGVDASLDARTAQVVGQYLEQNAGSERRLVRPGAPVAGSAPLLRISDADWFRREHREVPATTWKSNAIGSVSNCAACHTDAAQGRFSEGALRMPGGARNGREFGEENEHERERR